MAEIITLFGGDAGTGTTLLTGALAEALKGKNKKVLVILASSNIPEGYFTDEEKNNLGNLLRFSRLKKEDIKNCTVNTANFDLILGPSDILKKQFFDPKMLSEITGLISKDYDYILLDGGFDVTLPLSVSSLIAADRRLYVLTGSEKCKIRFTSSLSNVIYALGLDMAGDMIVLNKDSRRGSSYTAADIKNIFSLETIPVPMYPNPEVCESAKQSAYSRDSGYQKAVNLIADEILGYGGRKKR